MFFWFGLQAPWLNRDYYDNLSDLIKVFKWITRYKVSSIHHFLIFIAKKIPLTFNYIILMPSFKKLLFNHDYNCFLLQSFFVNI